MNTIDRNAYQQTCIGDDSEYLIAANLWSTGDHISQTSQWLDDAYYIKSSGLLGSSSETWINKVRTTEAQASSIGAETIQISAGRNLEVTGSNVVSDKGTALQAGQNITIAAATDTHSALHFNEERRSGVFSSGGIGFTVGSQMQSTDQRGQQTSAAGSTIGSIEGSVSIRAGQDYRQIGSDILAPAGDIAIAAKDIAIIEAEQTHNSEQHTRFKQSGISVMHRQQQEPQRQLPKRQHQPGQQCAGRG